MLTENLSTELALPVVLRERRKGAGTGSAELWVPLVPVPIPGSTEGGKTLAVAPRCCLSWHPLQLQEVGMGLLVCTNIQSETLGIPLQVCFPFFPFFPLAI